MAVTEYDVIQSDKLPTAVAVSDDDTLLVVQNGILKRVPPSLMKGEKGNSFTYNDFSASQIAELKKPATDAATAFANMTSSYADGTLTLTINF